MQQSSQWRQLLKGLATKDGQPIYDVDLEFDESKYVINGSKHPRLERMRLRIETPGTPQ